MLTKPPHIARAPLGSTELHYEWDEWDVQGHCTPPEPVFMNRMAKLSARANATMGIAICEWLVYRYENLSNDPMPLQYIEATWAATIHPLYARYNETEDDDWRGIVRGPIHLMLSALVDLVWGVVDYTVTPGVYPAILSKLTEHILPAAAKPVFIAWRDACLQRLEALYPMPAGDPDDILANGPGQGPWVPRELFDLDVAFDPRDTRALLERFLQQLDPDQNPYLRTRAELSATREFNAAPYTLPARDELA